MLVRLVPEQIAEGWDVVRPIIVNTLPPTLGIRSEAMSNVLKSLLSEEAQLWVYYRNVDMASPLGIVMTAIMVDPISNSRYLLIYSMSAIGKLTDEDYEEGLNTLRSYAEGLDCFSVLAYVEDDRFIERLRRVGGVKISNLMRL